MISVARYRFRTLLGILMALFVLAPVISQMKSEFISNLIQISFSIILTLSIIFAAATVTTIPRQRLIVWCLAVPALFFHYLVYAQNRLELLVIRDILLMAFLAYTVAAILQAILRSQNVSSEMLTGAICVYLLLVLIWSSAYGIVESLQPGSFIYAYAQEAGTEAMLTDQHPSTSAIYFSMVTLTTLGYGDIVPATPASRMLASLQALVGQIYIAFVVARLVGLYIVHRQDANE